MQSDLLVEQNKVQEQTQDKTSPGEQPQKRPYIYELDQMRAITILCMVAVHVLIYTPFLTPDSFGIQVQHNLFNTVHFTRTVFMFITAVALVATYYGKPFSFINFWKKRGLGVLIPYIIWTIIYTYINHPQPSPWAFLTATLVNVLSGRSSLQMYYITLTVQFYLLLPGFLWLLQRTRQHPWILLGVSFAVQFILWTVDYYTIEVPPWPSSGFWGFVAQYQISFVFNYELFFVMGGLVALHLSAVRAWVLSHQTWILAAFGVTLAIHTLVYVVAFNVAHLPFNYAVEFMQPVMVFYSAGVIAFLYWLSYRSVRKHEQQKQSRERRFWHTLSDASFGIFLVHPIVLGMIFLFIVPLRFSLPGLVSIALTWLLTALGSAAWSILFMNLPILSYLVGRSRRMSDPSPLTGWLRRRAAPRTLP